MGLEKVGHVLGGQRDGEGGCIIAQFLHVGTLGARARRPAPLPIFQDRRAATDYVRKFRYAGERKPFGRIGETRSGCISCANEGRIET